MRELIVRFRNNEDVKSFEKKINMRIPFWQNIDKIDVDTKEVKVSRIVRSVSKNYEWNYHWANLPEFTTKFTKNDEHKIIFSFSDNWSNNQLENIFEQSITDDTKSIWFPKYIKKVASLRFVGGNNPKYPVYIVSKNRAINAKWHTSHSLSLMGVKHYIVVEPNEVDAYSEAFKGTLADILELDLTYKDNYDCFSDLGNKNSTGPGAARNFCWDHSIKNGHGWHWVLDDNSENFYRYWRGRRIKCRTGEAFRSCEEFVDRYENIAIAGMNYRGFLVNFGLYPPYVTNTRIYSFLLIRNDIPYRWRGRYNEDTDLSLRALKDNWCTVQFNAFLAGKLATQTVGGGNSEEFYFKEGTYNKSQMLVDMHPDVTRHMHRFGRDHHYVDYSGFKQKLKLKGVFKNQSKEPNEKGLILLDVPIEICGTELDNRKYIEENFMKEEFFVDKSIYLLKDQININDLF